MKFAGRLGIPGRLGAAAPAANVEEVEVERREQRREDRIAAPVDVRPHARERLARRLGLALLEAVNDGPSKEQSEHRHPNRRAHTAGADARVQRLAIAEELNDDHDVGGEVDELDERHRPNLGEGREARPELHGLGDGAALEERAAAQRVLRVVRERVGPSLGGGAVGGGAQHADRLRSAPSVLLAC